VSTNPAGLSLLGDVGGTNVRFALLAPGGAQPEHERSLVCADYPGLEQAARAYLKDVGEPLIREAALDVATAITGDLVRLTNSPWAFSIEQTRRQLGLTRLLVINDFTALALALPSLASDDYHPVGRGAPVAGMAIGLIGPGTGLGVSGLLPCGQGWTPIQGEGGHVAFSPMTEREDALLGLFRDRYGHVSVERLVSGPGLVSLYEALCKLDQVQVRGMTPQQVTEAALAGNDAQCVEALALFCALLGTAAGNLAITLGARGGVFIGGGIVPRLGSYFDGSPFRARFEHKGRFSAYLAGVPTYVITAEYPALQGLAAALRA
jgi:glucokinase